MSHLLARTKNLLDNQARSREYRGVVYTVNADKSIKMYGTATSQVSFLVLMGDGVATNEINAYSTPIFKKGDSVILSTGSTELVRWRYTDGTYASSSQIVVDTSLTFSKDVGLIYVQVSPNVHVDKTIYPMIRRSDISDNTYEPYRIEKPLDHVYVKARTENLFDWSAATTGYRIQWLTGEPFADANAIMSDFIPVSAGIYRANASFNLVGYDENKTYVGTYDPNTRTFRKEYGSKTTFYGISDSNVAYVKLLSFANTDTLSESTMFNAGSTPLPYEPYLITKEAWEARTRVILHNLTNPLCGIGTYKDTLDLSTGVLTRYIKKLVLTGQEIWNTSNGACYIIKTNFPTSLPMDNNRDLICSHFVNGNLSNQMYNGNVYKLIVVGRTDVDGWKSYLAQQYSTGHPVTVWYVLETPETEQITVPSNLTGTVEGYLTQSSTPTPTSPVYPTANGTLEQGGTYSLDTGAYAIAWGRADTFTGTDPVSARCYGLPIKSWEIDGNSQQDGTPTPDNPITPEFVGERTGNLLDYKYLYSDNTVRTSEYFNYYMLRSLKPNTDYTLLTNAPSSDRNPQETTLLIGNSNVMNTQSNGVYSQTAKIVTAGSDGEIYIAIRIKKGTTERSINLVQESDFMNGTYTVMLNEGSTPLPYEPYGYKLPITNTGQTQNVYLGEVQTTRKIKKLVLDGTENWIMSASWERSNTVVYFFELAGINTAGGTSTAWIYSDRFPAKSRDDLYNADYNCIARTGSIAMTVRIDKSIAPTRDDFKSWLSQQYASGAPVIIWYILATPRASIVNEPLAKIGKYTDTLTSEQAGVTIPTTDGNNIISVDTTLAPSKMTITGHIRDVWFKQSITGVPPLSFKSNGMPLISLSMKGNGQQNGTPTPDNPITPTFCGERTKNIYNTQETVWIENTLDDDGNPTGSTTSHYTGNFTAVKPNTSYYISRIAESTTSGHRIYYYDSDKNWIGRSVALAHNDYSFTTVSGCKYIQIQIGSTIVNTDNWMISEGLSSVPYEPYGYKLPITNAGQTQNVYLGEVSTTRKIKKLVLTGEEETSRADTGGMRRYIVRTPISYADKYIGLCTHYQYNFGTPSAYGYCHILTDGTGLAFFDDRDISADAYKQWLAQQYAAGTPVTVWYVLATPTTGIVNEPLCRIGDYADTLDSEDAGITIPTAKGANTLTVDTDLQPSEMTITGYIKQE